jgi:hypothetical protein
MPKGYKTRGEQALSDLFCIIAPHYDLDAEPTILTPEEEKYHYRTCSKCGLIKPLKSFYKAFPKTRPTTYQGTCIPCAKKRQAAYNKKHRVEITEQQRGRHACSNGFINYQDYLNKLEDAHGSSCPLCHTIMTIRGYWEPVAIRGSFICKKCSLVVDWLSKHEDNLLDFYRTYVGELENALESHSALKRKRKDTLDNTSEEQG